MPAARAALDSDSVPGKRLLPLDCRYARRRDLGEPRGLGSDPRWCVSGAAYYEPERALLRTKYVRDDMAGLPTVQLALPVYDFGIGGSA